MGYKYQNRLDEENEREYWRRMPRWRRILLRSVGRILIALFVLSAIYVSYGWLLLKLF
mgnify:CR=1 FL=1